jgi:hypothetical protein
MTARRLRNLWLGAGLVLAGVGCERTPELSGELRLPDGAQFAREVYPVLLRDCAFPACHGAPERFLRVVGPGRTRLYADVAPREAPLLEEVVLSYERARSLLGSAEAPEDSLLLDKPLDIAAGGQTHGGADSFGRNLFRSTSDSRYVLLREWARSSGTVPDDETLQEALSDTLAGEHGDAQ